MNPTSFTLSPVAAVSAVPKVTLPGADAQLAGLMSADIHDISSQLDIQLEGRTAVDHIPKGLSALSQFLLCSEQLLENPYPEQWVMAPWRALRTNAGRASLIRKYQRPFASLKDPERDRCAKYMLGLSSEPVPPNTIGRAEFFGFIDCILQSRLNYERHITEGATWFQELEENVVGYRFRCEGFPGPPLTAQNWHLWAHATTREGATGILATGKVLPTDHAVAGLDPEEDTYSFFGRSTPNPEWEQGVIQLASKCFHSTKNCSGVVFAGLLPSGHVKGKSASVSYENNLARFHALVHSCSSDRRWAIRFVAARIDFIFVLSERAKANYPPEATLPAKKGPKAIQGQPTLAIADGPVADDSWGQWKPRPEPSQSSGVQSGFAAKAKEELAGGSDTEDLMASAKALRGQGR